MPYLVATKPSFMNEMFNLNRGMQQRVISAIDELRVTPNKPQGDTIKKLRYHKILWRYRIGDYRMVYAVYPGRDLIQLLGIGPRGEIYERMHYTPDEPQYADYSAVFEDALDPDHETPPDWFKYLEQNPTKDVSRDRRFY